MARLLAALAAVAAASLACLALAHGTTIPHDLAGVRLCVDDESLAVSFEADPSGLLALVVSERIDRAVHATFDAAALPWQRTDVCPEDRGYVEIALHVRDAAGFAPRAVEYDVAVRVGPRLADEAGVRAGPPDAFDFSERELFDVDAVGVRPFVFLPRYVEAGLRDLSVSWWEDREEAARALPVWVPWAGAALAIVTGAGCAVVVGRLRRARSRSRATGRGASRAYHRV
jgi:hypothetical protein